LKINGLHEYDGRVTGDMPAKASAGALVEFPARADTGFADD
jgi:hypothetical protein